MVFETQYRFVIRSLRVYLAHNCSPVEGNRSHPKGPSKLTNRVGHGMQKGVLGNGSSAIIDVLPKA